MDDQTQGMGYFLESSDTDEDELIEIGIDEERCGADTELSVIDKNYRTNYA